MAQRFETFGWEVFGNSPPQRIVSLCPPITELLFDMGAGARVVGVSKQCRFPEVRVRAATQVGGNRRPDIKLIQALRPDFIVLDARETDDAVIELLKEECPVWNSEVPSVRRAIEEVRVLGNVMDKSDNAEWIAKKIETRFAEFLAHFEKGKEVIRAGLLANYKPWTAFGTDTLPSELLAYIGVENTYGLEKGVGQADVNTLATSSDVILLAEGPYSFHKRHLPVISRKFPGLRVHLVREDLLTWHGSRLLRAPAYLEELHRLLLPR